jgi:hypothetical protein
MISVNVSASSAWTAGDESANSCMHMFDRPPRECSDRSRRNSAHDSSLVAAFDDRGHAPAQVLDPAQVGHVPPQLRGSTDLGEDVRRGLPQKVRLVVVVDVERRLRHARLCGESVDGQVTEQRPGSADPFHGVEKLSSQCGPSFLA